MTINNLEALMAATEKVRETCEALLAKKRPDHKKWEHVRQTDKAAA
jgi:hypothetical protein